MPRTWAWYASHSLGSGPGNTPAGSETTAWVIDPFGEANPTTAAGALATSGWATSSRAAPAHSGWSSLAWRTDSRPCLVDRSVL
ncbi:hypothetical protein ACFSTC_56185 [Nonomuraea ferruginea]